jgi:transcriptional regulator with XRE-family HTH domain
MPMQLTKGLTREQLRQWRLEQGARQGEVARVLGVCSSSVKSWESGRRRVPADLAERLRGARPALRARVAWREAQAELPRVNRSELELLVAFLERGRDSALGGALVPLLPGEADRLDEIRCRREALERVPRPTGAL